MEEKPVAATMRLFALLVVAVALLPFAFAAAPVRDDSTYPILNPQDEGHIYYLSLCRGDYTTNADPAVDLSDDCSTSGVYQESNNVYGLQVRPGIDSDGHPYAADVHVADLSDLPSPPVVPS